jgi:phosphohistidine phosphatase
MPNSPSTHRLYILRHAKSSWEDPDLEDHDRPLAPRGRRAGELLHEYVREQGIRPSVILCSTARRARETLEAAGLEGEIYFEDELYGASAGALVGRLRRVPRATSSVMLIGHDPALHDLLATLAPRRQAGKFPTGALATLTFTSPWSGLGPGGAELSGFVSPRDLA